MDIELKLISGGQEETKLGNGRSRLEKLSGENGWRFILGLTLYPFIIVGCPVFLIFDGEGPLKYKRRKERSEETEFWKRTPIPKGTIPWLRFVWTNERYRLAASANSSLHNYLYWIGLAVTSILTLIMNGLLWGEIGEILYYLLYLGELDEKIILSAHYVIILLPTVILIDYVWLFGYQLKATVESFDTCVILGEVDDFHASGSNLRARKLRNAAGVVRKSSRDEEEVVNDADFIENGSGALPLLETSDFSSKNLLNPSGMLLIFFYIIVCIIHLSRSLLIWHEIKFNVTISESVTMEEDAKFFNFAAIVSYTLGCPVYCCFCWGIYYQTASLIRYMDNMNLAGVGMNEIHLCAIKQAFKIIARNVTHLNYLFRMYLPALSLAFTGTVIACGYDFASFVTSIAWNEIWDKNSTSEESESDSDSSEDEELDAKWVRYGTGQVVNLGLNVGLVVLTLYQAKLVNFYIRYIHVKLNDFATGSYPHSNPCSQSVYQTFLLVKTYIHSRLEPGQRRPALMVTPGLATFIPFMKKYTTQKDISIRH